MMEISETLLAQQQVIRLQALLEASRQLHSTIKLEEVLHIALEIVVRELELTGAFFSTWPLSYGTVPPAFQNLVASNATMWEVDFSCGPLMRLPLRDKTGTQFTELVLLIPPRRTLDFDELDFLESLIVQAAVAIENAQFHKRALQWQRVESDLEAARRVQLSLIPQRMPSIPGYHLAAQSVTCYEVGGDYLDIVSLSSGKIVIVVADVAGKGLASALVGTSFRSALRAMVHSGLNLCEIATRMNLLHFGEGVEAQRRYVTALLMELDPAAHTLEVVNAGHNPAFLIAGDGTVRRLSASGIPIGMLPSSSYVTEEISLDFGARLLVYTDGMTEVFCGSEEFGEDRLLEAFLHCDELTADLALQSLWRTLETFSDGLEQSDDMTALTLFRG
ncbi:MAG: PP2C family protein-serine/threonine phosphatase [Edaphobacter sp.]|uniref:PP2C family protein-serine/threonine phosphatase n=1 Tax=Edaphobacter sp. TaxID=1934404 RepID=UPI0023850B89|nr:PP2C family protein-serine/threonine phosphatase [Edaphobacter sp.]MDE1178432.1 PP2C family protein-serine/threonine phosphatase [Edaphobacter sp.]